MNPLRACFTPILAVILVSGCVDSPVSTEQQTSDGDTVERTGNTADADRQKAATEDVAENLSGAAQAQADLDAGKLILREPPLPSPPWWNEYHRLLREECGVEIDVVDREGTALTDDDNAYNDVMKAAIEKRFQKGIIGQLESRAMESTSRPSAAAP